MDAIHTLVSRGILKEYDATGGQHLAKISGLHNEEFTAVPRMQQFGQSSYPPIGSHVLFTRLGAGSDRATIVGVDSAKHGPRDLKEGHKAIFDAYGNIVSLVQQKLRIVAAAVLEIVAQGDVTIASQGAITLTSTGQLTHNGKDVGSDHRHTGVLSGSSNTGVPV